MANKGDENLGNNNGNIWSTVSETTESSNKIIPEEQTLDFAIQRMLLTLRERLPVESEEQKPPAWLSAKLKMWKRR